MKQFYPRNLSWEEVIKVSEIGSSTDAGMDVIRGIFRYDHSAPLTDFTKVFEGNNDEYCSTNNRTDDDDDFLSEWMV